MAVAIDELQIEIVARATKAAERINATASALARLKGAIKGGAGLTTVSKQFERFSAAMNVFKDPTSKISKTVSALAQLQNIGKSNLGSTLNQLKKIPEISAGLDSAKIAEFGTKIKEVTDVVRPLATEMEKVSAGFSKLPANIQRAINANARLTSSNYTAQISFFKLSNIMAKVYVVKRIAGVIGGWIKESNDYVENLNLFTVAMGKYADSAKAYAEQVQEALGIDASEFMRYQGVFMNMARGFGIASDKAALMSKNLTQLGYDLASLYNVKFDTAMEKLASGLSGQPRPMREWGFDLSDATLKAKALELGIKKNVEVMNQGEKAMIRYVQVFDTARKIGATGDFARTINTSANQLRIFQSSVTLASRALGNIFTPALNAILPYAIAFLKVIRWVAQEIANLFGFTLPEVDYSGLDGFASGADDAADALDNAAGSAKKLKGMLAGFDEINVIQQEAGGGGGKGGGGSFNMPPLPSNDDWLGGLIDNKANGIFESWKTTLEPIIEWLKDNIKTILGIALDIGGALLLWKVGKSAISGITKLIDLIKNPSKLSTATKLLAGLVISIVGVKWSYEAGFAIGEGKAEFMDVVKAILGPIAAGVGGALIGSAIPGLGTAAGFVIGFAVGVVAELVGYVKGVKAAIDEAQYQAVVQSLKDNSTMAVTDAISLFSAWYDTWAPDNQVIIDLIKAKEDTAAEIETAYAGLQETFNLILSDGVVAKDELGKLTEAMNNYFAAITKDTSANNDIIHEALVGALGRASGDGVKYYQDLIDKHNDWIITEAGALGALQQQANDAAGALAIAAPGTADYAKALSDYNDAMGKLADYANAENTAKLQTYSEKITALKDAISSGTLDTSQLATAQEQLSTLGGKMQTLLTDIETAKEGVIIAVQTEINRATMFGEAGSAAALGDIKQALSDDFDTQKAGVIEFANGIGATIAEAIGSQMFNLTQTSSKDTIQRLVDEQYAPLLEAWATGAGTAITNSAELKKFPQLLLDTMYTFPEDASARDLALGWVTKTVDDIKADFDSVLKQTGLGDQAQGFMDGLTAAMASAKISTTDMDTSAGNVVDAFNRSADMNSPAKIMYPSGEGMTEGVVAGMIDDISKTSIGTAMNTLGGMITGGLDTAMGVNQATSLLKSEGQVLIGDLASGITDNAYLVTDSFKSVLNDMLTLMEKFTSKIATALNGMLTNFSSTMKSMSVSASGTVTIPKMSGVTIPAFASGGFPVPGELFIAREAGPELVGTMGGRTAVANNDQIETGLEEAAYRGFMRAFSQSNSGNSGNREIVLQVDGRELGRASIKNINGLQRAAGASLITY